MMSILAVKHVPPSIILCTVQRNRFVVPHVPEDNVIIKNEITTV